MMFLGPCEQIAPHGCLSEPAANLVLPGGRDIMHGKLRMKREQLFGFHLAGIPIKTSVFQLLHVNLNSVVINFQTRG